MNTDGTTYQNGLFVNVNEVHNNTKNMTLSGFNQIGGKVTGNIQNLTIESKQNISTTTENTKGGSIGFAPNGMPNSISANYSQTNGERKYVDTPTTFLIGDGSNLKIGKVENTAGAIGTSRNGKLSIDEYVGHNLENKDNTTTKGVSLSLSPNSNVISGVGINYANKDLESITKNTVVGNVEIGKSSGDEINKDLSTMTEVTKDEDTKTNVFVESQTIKYALNPESFKEDLQIALIEGKATGRTVVKTIDNIVNGDKSQDIGEEERRSLIEIKEAIVRVQTAPAIDIIAKEDLADKNVQKELGVEIEKFDPNDSTLSEKVKERLNELRSEGKEIVAFYDKVTGKIFVNKNAKDEEIRASIAREYKIKEDLELGRGKANDKGQLRSTVAGEIAYDEIKDRLKKGDKNPISASSFDIAKMDKDSEVTADNYKPEDRKLRKEYKEIVYFTDERMEQMSEGGVDMMAGGGTALAGGAVIGASIGVDYVSFGTTIVPSTVAKAGGATAVAVGGNRFITGFLKFINGLYGSGKKETLNPIRDSIPKKYQGYYDAFEITVEVGIIHLAPYAQPYYSQPNKSIVSISQQQVKDFSQYSVNNQKRVTIIQNTQQQRDINSPLNKQMNLNTSVGQQKAPMRNIAKLANTNEIDKFKLYSVVPEMSEIDMERGTLVNNSYIKNPSAKDITTYVNNTNYLGTGGKKGALNGEYMYTIDTNNNIIIGNRVTNQVVKKYGLPHPTLLGGKNPQVQGAGIIEIRGGKIYKIDNASGHFQPGTESLKRTEEVFREKIPSKYFSNDFEGFKTYDNK